MDTTQSGSENQGDDRNFEKEAREMGWVPKEEFHEGEEKWVDAQEFVERGEKVLPILRANHRKLRQELLTKDAAIAKLQESVAVQEKAIKALQKSYSESTARQVEQAKKELREQLLEARKVGDVDTELVVQEKMDELRQAEKEAKSEESKAPSKQEGDGKFDPVFAEWQKQNPWFGDNSSLENRVKTRELIKIGEELRQKGESAIGFDFMDKCTDILEKREAELLKNARGSKVEGGARGGSRKSGRAFDNLPKEAKSACHEDSDSFVGPGKMFKTVQEWEDHYAAIYGED